MSRVQNNSTYFWFWHCFTSGFGNLISQNQQEIVYDFANYILEELSYPYLSIGRHPQTIIDKLTLPALFRPTERHPKKIEVKQSHRDRKISAEELFPNFAPGQAWSVCFNF